MTDIDDRLDRLESVVEQQQEIIEDQQATIEDLQNAESSECDGERAGTAVVNRRNALKAGGLLALLGVGAGTASADAQGQVGTSSDPLESLYTAELTLADSPSDGTNDETVTTLAGEGLSITSDALTVDVGEGLEIGNGNVAATATRTDASWNFSEPTLDHTRTTVSDGDLVLEESVELESLTNSVSNLTTTMDSYPMGVEVSVSQAVDELQVGIGDYTSGAARVELRSGVTSVVQTRDFPGDGGSVTFDHDFSGGQTYYVTVNRQDDTEWTFSQNSNSPTQIDGEVVSIDSYGEVIGDTWDTSSELAWAIREITPIGSVTDGTTAVEWSRPPNVSRWETATYQYVPDGETVEVYVETNGGDGWSDWRSDPIGPGTDLSSVPSDERVRFRVELSRDDVSNDPRLTLLGRQWRS